MIFYQGHLSFTIYSKNVFHFNLVLQFAEFVVKEE